MRSEKLLRNKRTKRSRARWVIWVLLILMVGGGIAGFTIHTYGNPFVKQAAQTGPAYYTTVARRGNLTISIAGTGTLTAAQSVDLSFPTAGTVSKLYVKLGDSVTAGQTLAEMGNTDAINAAIADDQLQSLQDQQAVTSLQQNASVALAQAYQDWLTAQDQYQKALTADQRTAYARCSKEVNTKDKAALDAATQKLNDLTQSAYGSDLWITAKANYDTALANYNYCIAYTPDEKSSAHAEMITAQAAMQQAEANYNLLKANSGVDPNALALAQAKVDQAATKLEEDKKSLAGLTMTAPVSGRVIFLAGSQGEMVDTSKFITIADLSNSLVDVSIDEADMDKFTAGSSANVVFDALPDSTFTGKVTRVDPELTKSGQYQVATGQITLDEAASKALQSMPLGLNASVEIIESQAKNAILVPIQALRNLGNNEYAVFVVSSDGTLKLKPVKVGLMDFDPG